MLFMRRTHSIWSAALSASVTPSCFAIAETRIPMRSLQAFVDLRQMLEQRSLQHIVVVECFTILFQIAAAHTPVLADLILAGVRRARLGMK